MSRSLPYVWLFSAAVLLNAAAAHAQEEAPQPMQQQPAEAPAPPPPPPPPPPQAVPRSDAPRGGSRVDSGSGERTAPPAEAARPRGTDSEGRSRVPPRWSGEDRGRDGGRSGRAESARRRPEPAAAPAAPGTTSAAAPSQEQDDRRRAVPRGSRPRGDNPRVGTAVPRDGVPPSAHRGGGSGGYVYGYPSTVYNSYYYYPRRYYPYGYGAFGLGYFYYDPYSWYGDPYGYYGHSYWDRRPLRGFDLGELRLRVHPSHAEVYVDGYYAGVVDDFDGLFQALTLEDGPYRIEIVAPGYETLEFDVRITPGRKITYRGELRRRP